MHSFLRTRLLLSFLALPLVGISQSIPRVTGPGDANWDTRFGDVPPFGQGLRVTINSILIDPSGDPIIFGNSEDLGGVANNKRVARWDGTAWQPIGTGLEAFSSVAVWAPNGDIIAGMHFNYIWPDCIRRWDGTDWQMMGAGLGHTVISLAAAPNGNIIAGSNSGFTTLNNASLAHWDGTTWTAIDPARTQGRMVSGLTVLPNGDIIVGANFQNSPGNPVLNNIGRWDGSAWHPLGAGITNGQVWSMLVLPNGDLIVGGFFSNAGGNPDADGIARWDGTSWHGLGGGMMGEVYDLALSANGDIIAGGYFSTAGGVANTRCVARWDGTTWHPFGTGLNNTVTAVGVAPNGNIVVGGSFFATGDFSVPMLNFGIYQAHLTGTAPELASPAATAWPNPAHTTLHVQTPASTLLPKAVSLRDATGRVVRRQPVTGDATELTLDVADLPRGLYWLQTGESAGRRIVLE